MGAAVVCACVVAAMHVPFYLLLHNLVEWRSSSVGNKPVPLNQNLKIVKKALYVPKRVQYMSTSTPFGELALVNCRYGMATISRLLKLQVSFAEYSLFYKVLLQKKLALVNCRYHSQELCTF